MTGAVPDELDAASLAAPAELKGVRIHQGLLPPAAQAALLDDIRAVVRAAPLVRPVTPGGRAMSVRMTAAGEFGWITDRAGYRYERCHPSGVPWPPIPARVRAIWEAVAGTARMAESGTVRAPECCLVNWYADGARMGLHQDRDEGDFGCPVVSISLGDDALFRVGGTERRAPTRSIWLRSGDVAVMGGAARLAWHGVDRTRFASSSLLPDGGRINLTLRVVTPPDAGAA